MARLKDIAEKTGYSINTVSLALNRKGCVSKEAREVIEKVAAELGYVANSAAQKLRSGKSRLLALIIDDLSNPYFSVIADEIVLYSSKLGYDVNIYTTNGEMEREKKAIFSAISRDVDGIIITPLQNCDENINLLYKSNIPFVLLGRALSEFGKELSVTYDEIRCGYIAAEYLLLNGHKDIMVINSEKETYTNDSRLKGMNIAFTSYGKTFNYNALYNVPLNIHSRNKALNEIMKKVEGYTAIICHDDILALDVIRNLKDMGKSVPRNISVVGFGNVQKKIHFERMITTIDTCDNNISIEAVDLLIKKMEGDNPEKKILPVSIIKGDTVSNILR